MQSVEFWAFLIYGSFGSSNCFGGGLRQLIWRIRTIGLYFLTDELHQRYMSGQKYAPGCHPSLVVCGIDIAGAGLF